MTKPDSLDHTIRILERRLAAVEARDAVERLQYQYGFYLDNRMWDELAELFCDDAHGPPSIEIGRRGSYTGRDRVREFLVEVLGEGRWGLVTDEVIDHIQLQPLITVAEDGRTARCRSRALILGNSPPGTGRLLLAEGLYENRYVKQGEEWRIERLHWVPTFYTTVGDFDRAVFESAPPSELIPPDVASVPADKRLGRQFLPFHYPHPVTGAESPVPAADA
ncbi:nuclear transport factor 2 family protein [Streptomyces phaeochromogenes]|uniref:Nuclear transport factor 2 family protein n=1 Tax=Streptomyces phaeochromogenes TaxID=1923 RepID=A0ABZ1HM60_STRPH|nr:nuclear transport factor 2 family protein [Streptomyces phaeochromogenes]WSD19687.1 nuclear transport factor 2 family protein [Streptomyces phaeochromogenes]